MKKLYNHYLDKRKKIMISTKFKVEDLFGVVIINDSNSLEQIFKLYCFLARRHLKINVKIKFSFFNLEKKTNIDNEPSAPPAYE